jgi:hypothetical protein
LTFVRTGQSILMWRFADRDAARADAEARRYSLERAGWTAHW